MSELRLPCLYRGGDERTEVTLPIQGGSLQEQKCGCKKNPL